MAETHAEKIRIAMEEWAVLDGKARRYKEQAKIVLSELINSSQYSAISKAEHEARCNADYQIIVDDYVEAETAANLAKAKWKAAEVAFEEYRTREATRRAEVHNLR